MILAKKRSKTRTLSEPDYSCQAAIALIGDYLAGSITLHASEDFEHHLSLCPDCAAFLKTYKKTIAATRALLRSQTPNPRHRGMQLRERHGRSLAALAFWLHLFFSNMSLIFG
jgi:anti-sigma factor RsiW